MNGLRRNWLLSLLIVGAWCAPLRSAALAAEPALVQVQISITDEDSGLSVKATRQVKTGTSGLDAMKATVALEVKSYPGLGVRVLKICDVAPVRGKYWALFVDGKYADAGIADLAIGKATQIEWKTQK